MRICNPQKSYLCILSFISLQLLCAANTAHAGWSENVRLTYRGNEISPQVIAREIRCMWFGFTWGLVMSPILEAPMAVIPGVNIINLNVPGHRGALPTLNPTERGLLVSWIDGDSLMNISSIGIRKSSDGGATWSAPSYVYTNNPNHFTYPVSAVKGDSIFLVYYSYNNDSTGLESLLGPHIPIIMAILEQ